MPKRLAGLPAAFIALLFSITAMQAAGKDGPEIVLRSRALADMTVSGYEGNGPEAYFRLEDFRIGIKASYKTYEIKADLGYGDGKVKIKDLLMNFRLGDCILSVGNAYEPFSMDMLISTADLRFHQSAASVLAFTDGRKLGATIHYRTGSWYLATGLYTCNDINSLGDEKKNIIVSTSRAAWRKPAGRRLLHAGAAFSYRSRELRREEGMPEDAASRKISSAGITSMFARPLLEAEIPDCGSQLKGALEFLYMSERWMIQAEYYLNRINRLFGGECYTPHGGYVQACLLIKGKGFGYDMDYGIPERPAGEKALELAARLNYTNLDDPLPGIFGGEETDLSLGVNFYIDRHIGIKFNVGYVWPGRHCNPFYSKNLFLAQVRLQYII